MKKDAFYFPHFSNARGDRKLKRVIKDLGLEGYGIYFMLLEVLRDQQDFKYPLGDVDLLSDEFSTSEAKISAVIKGYDLFQVDTENRFFSMKQILYLQPYIEKTERARKAANIKWQKLKELNQNNDANADANALHLECASNASKVKEIKKSIDTNVSLVELPKATATFDARCLKFIQSFNEIRGSKFRVTESVKTKLKARLKTHSPAEILQAVTNAKKDNFHVENSYKYLTPDYILRSDILEKYLNMSQATTTKTKYWETN